MVDWLPIQEKLYLSTAITLFNRVYDNKMSDFPDPDGPELLKFCINLAKLQTPVFR